MSQKFYPVSSKNFKMIRSQGSVVSALVFYWAHIFQQAQARDAVHELNSELDTHAIRETSNDTTTSAASMETLEPMSVDSSAAHSVKTTLVVDEEDTEAYNAVITGKDAVEVSSGGVNPIVLLGGLASIGGGAALLTDDDSNSNNDTEVAEPVTVPNITINPQITGCHLFSADDQAQTVNMTVFLSAPSTEPVTVYYATSDDTASAGENYDPISGTLTFAEGETSKHIGVTVYSDGVPDGPKTLTMTLSDPVNAELAVSSATLTIKDFDEAPAVSIADGIALESAGSAVMTLSLSQAFSQPVGVKYQTFNDTAICPDDFISTAGKLWFLPCETSKTIEITVNQDEEDELDEVLYVKLLSVTSNATLFDDEATLTIIDDDEDPFLTSDLQIEGY